jgi:hypothetical protein
MLAHRPVAPPDHRAFARPRLGEEPFLRNLRHLARERLAFSGVVALAGTAGTTDHGGYHRVRAGPPDVMA